MTKTIKLNNVEVSVDEIRKAVEANPEIMKKEEKPLGDDFSMLGYLKNIRDNSSVSGFDGVTENRLNALITIWEWKEENDGEFGVEEMMDEDVNKNYVYFDVRDKKLKAGWISWSYSDTELPHFSTEEIAERSIKELEQEYKVVFNVK